MIAAGYGDNDSLENIKQMFMHGLGTKEDYAKVWLSLILFILVHIQNFCSEIFSAGELKA